ncbi:hypothetical protein BH09ACT6_BH09ACT6_21040 [soil metagenome]
MVATLLKLRFRVLANTLRRSTWQLVAVVIGALYGLAVLAFVVIGLVALGSAPVELATTIIVLAGSAVVLGWIVVPLILVGVDQTLEPAKLAQFPIPMPKLLIGLALAGVLGVPGVITGVAALATTAAWVRSPVAAGAAIVCAVIATFTCVVGSRMVTALSVSLASRRRFREVSGILIFVPLVLLGPIIFGIARAIAKSTDSLPGFAAALGWTPLGAAWAVPGDLALGDYGAAGARFVIALATFAALALVWRRSLATALVTSPVTTDKRVARGKIGLFGLLPATPAGAVAARSLTYWLRDPRYARQLVAVPLIPVLLYFYSNTMGSFMLLTATGPIVAFLLSLATYADLSYDGTAFATHIADGVRGRDDRLGRAVALAIVSLPFVIALTIVSVAVTGSWTLLPALLGMAFGTFLSGVGLTAVSSARVVIPVPSAGDNPFKSAPGAGFTTAVSSFATWGILLVLTLPEAALGISSIIVGSALLGWLTLLIGVVFGLSVAALGILRGGAAMDRSAPELLTRLKALTGA